MTRTRWALVAGACVVATVVAIRGGTRPVVALAAGATRVSPTVALAAPGRVEGVREAAAVGAGVDGVVRDVLVQEGDRVHARQVLAHLDCADIESDVRAASAGESAAAAARARLLRGGREDVRAAARADVRAAEARFANAALGLERSRQLFNDDRIVARSVVDDGERDERVALEGLEAARQRADVARAEPLPEERAAADAAVSAAHWTREAATARLEKCTIRSPIDGTVLRRHLEPGERIAVGSERPLVTIADLSSLRVRVEVDERDVAALRVGQSVHITAEALGQVSVGGVVSRISPEMGRKSVRSGDPAEKADRDVLEVIVDLAERTPVLVYGLRVTALFLER